MVQQHHDDDLRETNAEHCTCMLVTTYGMARKTQHAQSLSAAATSADTSPFVYVLVSRGLYFPMQIIDLIAN